jgi:large subunit ribosomal protein L24
MNKIKKGDSVKILAGKDSGRTGTVDRVLVKSGKVVVAGVNVYKRSVKKQGDQQGGIIDLIKPVDASNVILVCPSCKKVTKVGFKIEGKEKIRICKKCGKEIK